MTAALLPRTAAKALADPLVEGGGAPAGAEVIQHLLTSSR